MVFVGFGEEDEFTNFPDVGEVTMRKTGVEDEEKAGERESVEIFEDGELDAIRTGSGVLSFAEGIPEFDEEDRLAKGVVTECSGVDSGGELMGV